MEFKVDIPPDFWRELKPIPQIEPYEDFVRRKCSPELAEEILSMLDDYEDDWEPIEIIGP